MSLPGLFLDFQMKLLRRGWPWDHRGGYDWSLTSESLAGVWASCCQLRFRLCQACISQGTRAPLVLGVCFTHTLALIQAQSP